MSASVPSILKYLSSNNHNILYDDQNRNSKGKKRRLDHLSWEEKLQRKKLKNRVAAQTSRDRKKAKMEAMEQAVNELYDKNDALVLDCANLKDINKQVMAENEELRRQLAQRCSMCSQNRPVECDVQNRSAEGSQQTLSSGFEYTNNHSSVEDYPSLPSLPDFLDDLDADVDISSLEQLTQSLLQDIATDLEAAAKKADYQESTARGSSSPTKMVGSTSENLESSGCKGIKNCLKEEISPFLLIHEDSIAKQNTVTQCSQQLTHSNVTKPTNTTKVVQRAPITKKYTNSNVRTKPKEIRPKIVEIPAESRNKTPNASLSLSKVVCNLKPPKIKIEEPDSELDVKNVATIKKVKVKEQNVSQMIKIEDEDTSEVLYGTYDPDNNCITIFVNDDNCGIGETVMDVTSEDEAIDSEFSLSSPHQSDSSIFTSDGEFSLPSPHQSDISIFTSDSEFSLPSPHQSDSSIFTSDSEFSLSSPHQSDSSILTVPSPCSSRNSPSPSLTQNSINSATSDCGYDSLDSPNSSIDINDATWDKSVSELFPQLM